MIQKLKGREMFREYVVMFAFTQLPASFYYKLQPLPLTSESVSANG